MSHGDHRDDGVARVDVGAYCRQVEARLTQENAGHLVRIVGPAFDLVRRWALDGVPISVVFQGIAQKAERHRAGRSTHPLRLEFCESDVRALFEHWRRAVGVSSGSAPDAGASPDEPSADEASGRPSLSRHLERAIARLTTVAGRPDVPEAIRALAAAQLEEVTAVRQQARTARGAARAVLVERLAPLQRAAAAAARDAAPATVLAELTGQAERDLAGYRQRLHGQAWQRAIDVTVDRLLRDRFGLPTLEW